MILPEAAKIKAMPNRDMIALGAEWFDAEGKRENAGIGMMTAAYGPEHINRNMHVRANANFALANFLRSVNEAAQSPKASREDGVVSIRVAGMLMRLAFLSQDGG